MNNINHDIIQTLRTAHQNQAQLNLMADQKANILIGALILMYTMVFSRLLTLAEYSDQVMVPLAAFVVLGILPLAITTFVLVPRNIKEQVSEKIEHMPNPLFFGFFTEFSEREYVDYMTSAIDVGEKARRLMLKDLYQIGVVLKRKYRLLRLAYIFAMLFLVAPVSLWLVIYFENN